MLYVYKGSGVLVGSGPLKEGDIAVFDGSEDSVRGFELSTGPEEAMRAMLFAGKKLKEQVVWHGPLVMNTKQQIQETFAKIRAGEFPPVRAAWDYKRIATRPKAKA
eukprot:2036605-Rhodomonas_salina.1